MNDEQSTASALLHCLHRRHDDGDDFVCFLHQRRETLESHDVAFDQQFEPVKRFIELLERSFQLANEFCVRSGSECFATMRSGRRARTDTCRPRIRASSVFGSSTYMRITRIAKALVRSRSVFIVHRSSFMNYARRCSCTRGRVGGGASPKRRNERKRLRISSASRFVAPSWIRAMTSPART